MHITIRQVPNFSFARAKEIASYIQGCIETLDDNFSVAVHGDGIEESLEIMEEWKLTKEQLEDLES